MTSYSAATAPADTGELTLPVEAGTTVESLLAALKRQGVSDLDDFVDRSLAFVKAKETEAQGDDDAAWVREVFLSREFFYANAHAE